MRSVQARAMREITEQVEGGRRHRELSHSAERGAGRRPIWIAAAELAACRRASLSRRFP